MAVYFIKNGFDSYTSIKAPARKFQQCNLWVQITFVFHVMFSNNVSLVKFSSVNSKASQGAEKITMTLKIRETSTSLCLFV